jgi:hypothetical protein
MFRTLFPVSIRHISSTFRTRSGHFSDTFGTFVGHVQDMFRTLSGHLSDMFSVFVILNIFDQGGSSTSSTSSTSSICSTSSISSTALVLPTILLVVPTVLYFSTSSSTSTYQCQDCTLFKSELCQHVILGESFIFKIRHLHMLIIFNCVPLTCLNIPVIDPVQMCFFEYCTPRISEYSRNRSHAYVIFFQYCTPRISEYSRNRPCAHVVFSILHPVHV